MRTFPGRKYAVRIVRRLLGRYEVYDPAVHGLYSCEGEVVVPRGQAFYDPVVFGRYDLASHRVVPKDETESIFALDLDSRMAEAQRFSRSRRPLESDRYSLVLDLLPPGDGICLDACTASPEERVRVAVTERGYEYVPIDLYGDDLVARQEDLRSLRFDDRSVSCIISLDTLEHIEDYEQALSELHRVLRPGGLFFLHVPCYYVDKPTSEPTRPSVDPWGHVRYFAARELVENVVLAGFLVLRLCLNLDYGAVLLVAARDEIPR